MKNVMAQPSIKLRFRRFRMERLLFCLWWMWVK